MRDSCCAGSIGGILIVRGCCFGGGGSCSFGLSFGLPETLIQIGVAELGFVGIFAASFRLIGRGFFRGQGFLSGYPMPGLMCGGNALVLFWGIRIRMVLIEWRHDNRRSHLLFPDFQRKSGSLPPPGCEGLQYASATHIRPSRAYGLEMICCQGRKRLLG